MKMSLVQTTVVSSLALAAGASADIVQLRISVENLAPTNSVSFAPLRFGLHDGTFDTFNAGETATAPIISIAEGGSGSDWFPFFAAQQPNGVSGTVLPNPAGPLLPGGTGNCATHDARDMNGAVRGWWFYLNFTAPRVTWIDN